MPDPTNTPPRPLPIAVVMITLNEAHNLREVLESIRGWAQEVVIVDSFSADATVDIALEYGAQVVQRRFRGFGDQWNFALGVPVTAPWTMKLDPDERLTDELKASIAAAIARNDADGLVLQRRLWFMGKVLPVNQPILRLWRTGRCRFTEVAVNEHPLVEGRLVEVGGYLEHRDSPDLDHWITKQNRYTTAEAISQFEGRALAAAPSLLGSALERRMWIKKYFWRFPGRYLVLFGWHFFIMGAWRAGRVGWMWSHLRTEVYRMWEYKRYELDLIGHVPGRIPAHPGQPDPRVRQAD